MKLSILQILMLFVPVAIAAFFLFQFGYSDAGEQFWYGFDWEWRKFGAKYGLCDPPTGSLSDMISNGYSYFGGFVAFVMKAVISVFLILTLIFTYIKAFVWAGPTK